MKTLLTIPTLSDPATLPGGVILRARTGEFIVHDFAIIGEEIGYHNGGYHQKLSDALQDITIRVRRAENFDRGGAIDYAKIGLVS